MRPESGHAALAGGTLRPRGRLVTGLQSFFGKRSQELRQFGIDPLLPNTRRKRQEPAPAPQASEAVKEG